MLGVWPEQDQQLVLLPGVEYNVRVYNGSHGPWVSFTVPFCADASGTIGWDMPLHAYPIVDFDWTTTVNKDDPPTYAVQFEDKTEFYADPSSWFWDFGDTHTSELQNPENTYNAGKYNVQLTATDADNYSCSKTKPLDTSGRRRAPIFREINPLKPLGSWISQTLIGK